MAMTPGFLTEQAELEYEEFTLFVPGVLGVEISARRALTKALKSLARQLGLDDTQVVINRLRQGHGDPGRCA